MRSFVPFLTAVSLGAALLFATSCGVSTYERSGDGAYMRAQRLRGDEKEFAQKQAYQLYLLAIKYHPDNIGYRLRSRFVEMSIARARMILSTDGLFADALPFFIEDIDNYCTPAMPAYVKQGYALFLVQMADSFSMRDRYLESLRYLDKAITGATDRGAIGRHRDSTLAAAVKENFDRALREFTRGSAGGDGDALVRAEYYVRAALVFDSSFGAAKRLLSDCRKKTIGICCDYRRALDSLPDTLLFRRVEKNTLYLAVPSLKVNDVASLTVLVSNYSNGAIALKAGNFFLVNSSGTRYRAFEADSVIVYLDQYRKASFPLRFPRPTGAIARLVFENGTHSTEKDFF
jgi:hypothetical protein